MPTNTFRNAGLAVSTSKLQLYKATTSSVVHAVYLSNILDTGEVVMVTLSILDASSNKEYILAYKTPVIPGSTLVFDKPVNLELNDAIKIKASHVNSVNAFASILEISS